MTAPVSIGELFEDKYRIENILGEGGMGVVVAATHEQLHRKVAIKFLLPELSSHEEVRKRFVREARAAASLESEHVAHVLDVVENEQGTSFMVIEFLDGTDLADLIESEGTIEPEVAVDYVLQACEALAEAHRQGIVHRDLKPGNLFLSKRADDSLTIKVLDFGISKVSTQNKKSLALTQDADVLGSPLYMPPEQIRSSKNVDPRSDIWAIGIILFEFLAGDVPFPGDTIQEVMSKVLFEPPPNLLEEHPNVPEGLWAVIRKCLEKQPDDRYQNLAELAMDLEPFGPSPRATASVERIVRVQKSTAYKATKPVDTELRKSPEHKASEGNTTASAGRTMVVTGDDTDAPAKVGADTSAAVSTSVNTQVTVDAPSGQRGRGMLIAVSGIAIVAVLAVGYLIARPAPVAPAASSDASSSATELPAASVSSPASSTTATAQNSPPDAGCGDDCGVAKDAPTATEASPTKPPTEATTKRPWHKHRPQQHPTATITKPPPVAKTAAATTTAKPAPTPPPTKTSKPKDNNPLNVDIK